MNTTGRVDVAPHLWREGADGPTLLGSRCETCGELFFPQAKGCTRCCGTTLAPCELGGRGTLWSWTVQCFMPKSPYNGNDDERGFTPYGIGYVELPSGLRVESRLTTPRDLSIGMPMRLEVQPYRVDEQGRAVRTFAFTPEIAA